jgi:hypothetical protein
MTKRKGKKKTNNDLQSYAQKTKINNHTNKPGMNSGASEG